MIYVIPTLDKKIKVIFEGKEFDSVEESSNQIKLTDKEKQDLIELVWKVQAKLKEEIDEGGRVMDFMN